MAFRSGDVDAGELDGDWIEGLAGDGRIVAVSRYTTERGNFVRGSLRLILVKGLKTIARGFDSFVSASASSGRIAVRTSRRKVTLFSSAGRLLGAFDANDARDAALTATRLVVLTDANLQVFDVKSGKLLHTWPANKNGRLLDADSGLATYAAAVGIYVMRLSDGKSVRLAKTYVEGLQFEPAGLVYATPSKLVRYSLKQVQAALR